MDGLLENFAEHWEDVGDDTETQHELVKLIVERVYVDGDQVMAITLKADYHVVLGHKGNRPTDVPVDLSGVYTSGSDGDRSRSGSMQLVLIPPYPARDQAVDMDWQYYLSALLSSQ